MEKKFRFSGLLTFVCVFSLSLGALGLGLSCLALQGAMVENKTGALEEVQCPLDDVPAAGEESRTEQSLDAEAAPKEQAPTDAAPVGGQGGVEVLYTVRLLPDRAMWLGIYDAQDTLLERRDIVEVGLCEQDRAALRSGITADSLGSARRLMADFCE